MDSIVSFLVDDFLTTPTLLIGIMVFLGYVLQKAGAVKTITGSISAMVGLQLVIFGGSEFSSVFRPITEAVCEVTGITGYIMDSYAMRSTSQEALGDAFGWMAFVFLIAFAVNIVLVFFGKYTKVRGVFLTGNSGTTHSQAVLWLIMANLALPSVATVIVSGVLLGIYWSVATTLAADVVAEVTDGAGFTIGHNQTVGLWVFGRLAPLFAGKKKIDCEDMKLPGWLAIFNNSTVSVAIILFVFTGLFCIPLGISGIEELSDGQHWLIYLIMVGIQFSMYMVILLQGVRMLCAELTVSFQGIQQKIVPNAVPAIDVAALLPFSPNAATFGFLFCTLGTVFSMAILLFSGSSIMMLPGFTPLLFSGGPIGVIANKKGGLRAVVICCFLLGIIQTFGTCWAITQVHYASAVGWSGMFDFATVWPAIIQVVRWVGSIFGVTIAY